MAPAEVLQGVERHILLLEFDAMEGRLRDAQTSRELPVGLFPTKCPESLSQPLAQSSHMWDS